MFGFLKQKIADFGNKLKETVSKEEKKQPTEKEAQEQEKKETAPVKTETKTQETKPEVKKEETTIKEKETKKEELKENVKIEEKTVEKKTGLLGKIFGIGKKKEEKTVEKEKKTKEEVAEELEKKLFEDIEKEIKKEEQESPKETTKIEEKPFVKAKEEPQKKEIVKTIEIKELEKIVQEEKEQPQIEPLKKEEKIVEEEEEIQTEEEKDEEIKEIAAEKIEKPRDIKIKSIEEDKRELKTKVGITGGLKGLIFGGVEINEKQIEDLLWELELSLIESDVEQDAAKEITKQIKQRIVGMKVPAKNIDEYLKEQIKEILAEMMKTEKINLLEETVKHKPLKILMLGPNGAGKTTSIAKLVNYFQKNKKTCIVAAADTFRAGAIDQLEEHAKKLNIRVIKQQYGADPAAVAFDAVKAAEAGKIDVVIIDSAGRQETNKNLMEELRKIERVTTPDLKLYVGEAYVGQTLLEQVNEFEEIAGIDGFILTKIDTDAKGGTAISLLYKTKKPILFVGTGQGYNDFKEFTPGFILERII
ncbi:MAG: signal recognition particle-docking protein FtsY [archaeon]